MKLEIAIIDDDREQTVWLSGLLQSWAQEKGHLVRLYTYYDAKSFLFEYASKKDFDILLLDVEMPEVSGVSLAKTIRSENAAVQIIFVTGFYEYFSDAFDVSALHYLLKPVDAGRLYPVLQRAAENLHYRERSILVQTEDERIKIPLADILYLEAENVHVNIHTVHGVLRTRATLSGFAGQMDETFFKIHRSYIVSLKYIKKISRRDVTMANGDTLPMSRGMYAEVHEALIRFL